MVGPDGQARVGVGGVGGDGVGRRVDRAEAVRDQPVRGGEVEPAVGCRDQPLRRRVQHGGVELGDGMSRRVDGADHAFRGEPDLVIGAGGDRRGVGAGVVAGGRRQGNLGDDGAGGRVEDADLVRPGLGEPDVTVGAGGDPAGGVGDGILGDDAGGRDDLADVAVDRLAEPDVAARPGDDVHRRYGAGERHDALVRHRVHGDGARGRVECADFLLAIEAQQVGGVDRVQRRVPDLAVRPRGDRLEEIFGDPARGSGQPSEHRPQPPRLQPLDRRPNPARGASPSTITPRHDDQSSASGGERPRRRGRSVHHAGAAGPFPSDSQRGPGDRMAPSMRDVRLAPPSQPPGRVRASRRRRPGSAGRRGRRARGATRRRSPGR